MNQSPQTPASISNHLQPIEASRAAPRGSVFLLASVIITTALLIGLPIAGIMLSGRPVEPYFHFPPLTLQVNHAPFSWGWFCFFALLDIILLGLIIVLMMTGRLKKLAKPKTVPGRFPLWGWIGLAIGAAGWLLAWTRFRWFAPLQAHTFCLPWIGYIMVINALTVKRSGTCLITRYGGLRFGTLIAGSAVFWWFFEYLNRFVQNWYYIGVATMGPVAYTLFASLAFATVLPAVLSTRQWLLTFDRFGRGLQTRPLSFPHSSRTAGAMLLVVSSLGLAGLGIWPDRLFALVWVAPLLIITGLQALAGRPTLFFSLREGDWRPVISAAAAALICGFFWELWNMGSLARWQYTIPYVDRFHLFAMPALGYGGYLPFGLECLVFGRMILKRL